MTYYIKNCFVLTQKAIYEIGLNKNREFIIENHHLIINGYDAGRVSWVTSSLFSFLSIGNKILYKTQGLTYYSEIIETDFEKQQVITLREPVFLSQITTIFLKTDDNILIAYPIQKYIY
jgi:hypothetical protein